ncbi:hypothetical protein [Proteus mirabilis]|nr:hypothetical protein [Proteus mirabilis]
MSRSPQAPKAGAIGVEGSALHVRGGGGAAVQSTRSLERAVASPVR